MSLFRSAKAWAGKWAERGYRGPEEKASVRIEMRVTGPIPVAVGAEVESADDGTGIWLPAGLVSVHDEVNIAGRWFTVTGTETREPSSESAGFAQLDFEAWSQRTLFTSRVYVRDAAAVLGAEIKAACHGVD